MAHLNIDERRADVAKLKSYDRKELFLLSQKYGCSFNAVRSDYAEVNRIGNKPIYVGRKIRLSILERDKKVCQYCGKMAVLPVIDHVIPFLKGGHAKPYNLVVACHRCNLIKRNDTWIPNNSEILKSENSQWFNLISEQGLPKKDVKKRLLEKRKNKLK